MASWVGDGTVSGYNPTTRKLDPAMFKLASAAAVPLDGRTRLQWALAPNYPGRGNYPTRIDIKANFTFTSGDFSTSGRPAMGLAVCAIPASAFAQGATPTLQQLFDKATVALSNPGSTHITTPGTNVSFQSWIPGTLLAGTRYWILAYPAAIRKAADPWSKTNYEPRGNINSVGRAISVWTNRTPAAPTIATPPAGGSFVPGSTYNLSFTTADPDAVTPDDAARSNRDLAALQIQYAAQPTAQNPNPEWQDLLYRDSAGEGSYVNLNVGAAANANGLTPLRNLGLPIRCGGSFADVPNGAGLLPGGNWQIRLRVGDFGHPYPNIVQPLGEMPGTNRLASEFPSSNLSPWSNSVNIYIPSQVPPPIPLYPIQSRAVIEDDEVPMGWNYRNTAMPPYAQRDRWVQIRKVGDPSWVTVFAGPSSSNTVTLPPSITNPAPIAPVQMMSDPGFEAGTLGGWTVVFGTNPFAPTTPTPATTTIANAAVAGAAHSGTRYLQITNTTPAAQGFPFFFYKAPINRAQRDLFKLEFWHRPPTLATGTSQVVVVFLDASNNVVVTGVADDKSSFIGIRPPSAGVWEKVDVPELIAPPTATQIVAYVLHTGGGSSIMTGARLDDVSLIAGNRFETGSFSLEATTEYEWRVRVTDTMNVDSDWSQTARFWVVPRGASAEVIPTPEETIDGATLGCGKHRVFIYRRGGLRRVAEIKNISYLDWGRLRDDISTAQIQVSGWDVDCGALLADLQTWAYEIVIFRNNGFSEDRVWEGPITLLTYEEDKVTIQARDVAVYLYRRILRQAMNDSGANRRTVVARAAQIVRNALAPDDPNLLAYLQVLSRPDDATQGRNVPAFARTAYEEIDDMAANAGLDYTAVGRSIILWGTRSRIGTLPTWTDEQLGSPPIVSEYGMQMANVYAVSDGNGIYGEANRLDVSGNDEIYGRVEMLSSSWATDSEDVEYDVETTSETFKGFAERGISDRYPPPVIVRVPDNTSLNPDTVLSIQHLVPGVVVRLRSNTTLRTVSADQKLDSIRVVEQDGVETISVTLSPFNYDDASAGGETE